MGKIREWFENLYTRFRGAETVNCSTCPNWRFHSTLEPRPTMRGVMDENGNVKVVRSERGQSVGERIGVCMKAPLVFVPMQNLGLGVRATTAQDVCAHHPEYVETMRTPSGAQFLPGVGEHAGFTQVPTFKDALTFMRPKLAPDGKTVMLDFSRLPNIQQDIDGNPMDPPKAPE